MKNNFFNEYIVLSGASGGIGRRLCKLFILRYGAKVIGIGRDESKMLSLKAELGEKSENFSWSIFDVGNKSEWERFAADLSEKGIRPKLLINNAGAFPTFARALDKPTETVERIMQTNFFSAVYSTAVFKGRMAADPIVYNICSSAALCPVVGTAAYSASKGAMKSYTEALALEEKGRTFIGLIFPGSTATDLFRQNERMKGSPFDRIAMKPEKMAKKIARAIVKKKRRKVLGWDAKLMSFLAKLAPVKGPRIVAWVLKKSKSEIFSEVFISE